jgi:hypothetical protein
VPFLDDFANAVSGYPAASVVLSIVDTAPVPPATPVAVNVNEIWSFQVRVRNNGHLNMTGISLHVFGENQAQVSTNAAGPWSSAITFGNLTVNAHGGQQDTVDLFFKAPAAIKPAGTVLVSAHINTFDVNLNDVLLNHSTHSFPPNATHAAQVHP